MGNTIEDVISAQTALIAALDAGDVAAIEGATTTLAAAVAGLRGAMIDPGADAEGRLDHALRQGEAARTRVNFLADRNRQKFERLTGRHPAIPAATYSLRARSGLRRAV